MPKPTKLSAKKCSACYGKRYYTVMIGIVGAGDWEMGERGFFTPPTIRNVACPKCNWHNRRRIKNVQKHAYA